MANTPKKSISIKIVPQVKPMGKRGGMTPTGFKTPIQIPKPAPTPKKK